MKDDRQRLQDILEVMDRIQRYIGRGERNFYSDELVQTWMVHPIQILGEDAAKLSREVRDQYPQVPWSQIVAMRNILVHDYFPVDLNEVWLTATRDIPLLKTQIEAILRGLAAPLHHD
jgi:uncharacterized protein with HEPN domain